ncbi:hypothetical protein LMG28614_04806 [Paraburkholderia ultramafica]|uniref:Uncharacterized protein n=1 Tax=Paraburkholderia ultramafica TaxID=1544867 RepID=A0A6S7BFV0_9BURK|nr:hypothetical protein LMG28614_04806 [Paraburkholderia ultramafica]
MLVCLSSLGVCSFLAKSNYVTGTALQKLKKRFWKQSGHTALGGHWNALAVGSSNSLART